MLTLNVRHRMSQKAKQLTMTRGYRGYAAGIKKDTETVGSISQ